MADYDGLTVTFSADISNLRAGLSQATSAVQGAAAAMRSSASATAQATAAHNDNVESMKRVASAAHGAGAGIGFYAREIHALADETLSGRLRQAQGTAANLLLTIAQSRPDLAGAVVGFAALAGTIAFFAIRASEAANALQGVKLALTLGDATGLADADIQGLISTIQQLPGSSYDTAKEVVGAFAEMQNSSAPLIKGLVGLVGDYAAITGDKLPEAEKALVDLFSKPLDAGAELQKLFPAITGAELANYNAARSGGSVYQAQAALLQIVSQRLDAGRAILAQHTTSLGDFYTASVMAESGSEGFADAEDLAAAAAKRAADATKEHVQAVQNAATALKSMPAPADQTMRTGIAVGEKEGSPQDSLDKQKTAIQQMSEALDQLRAKATASPTEELQKQVAKLAFELEAAKEKAEGLKNSMQGGSDRQLQQAVAARAADLGKISETEQLQQDIQADKDALASATLTASERESITQEMYGRIKQLRETDAADTKSKADLAAAQAARGSDAEYAARAAGIRASMAVKNAGDAAYIQGETDLTNLARQQADARSEIARYAEQQTTQATLQGIAQRMQAVKMEAQEGTISSQQELQQLLALQAQKEAAERADLEFKLKSYKDDADAYARTQIDIANLAQKSATEQKAIVDQVNKEIEATYKQTFERVGSSVSSAIVGMITEHEKLRTAVGSILKSLLSMFIENRVKMVADSAAGIAQQTAQQVAGQTVQTTAVVAGNAARTGATVAGNTAQASSTAAANASSLLADAKRVYGGVYAFLAPVLGPLAAAPATLAAATVASYAVGAWNLPSDQIAQLHAGEMVVPASPAQAFRDAIGAGGGGGGDMHLHLGPGAISVNAQPHHSAQEIASMALDGLANKAYQRRLARIISTTPY